MKKNNDPVFTFHDENGKELFKYGLTSIPLREEAVLRLSNEFFGDPEPCMIHRSVVMSRMYMEILDYYLAENKKGNQIFQLKDIPEEFIFYINIYNYKQIAVEFLERRCGG